MGHRCTDTCYNSVAKLRPEENNLPTPIKLLWKNIHILNVSTAPLQRIGISWRKVIPKYPLPNGLMLENSVAELVGKSLTQGVLLGTYL